MPADDFGDEFEVYDQRQEKFSVGGRSSIFLPSGLEMFNNKRSGTVRVEFVPFQVTSKHLEYSDKLQLSRPGSWYPERTYYVHGGIGVDNATYTCAQSTFDKPCFLCEMRARLAKSPHKQETERAYELKPKARQMFLPIERNERTGELDGNIRLWEESYHSFGKQLDQYIRGADPEDRESYRFYYHPTRGYTVKLTGNKEKTGDGGGEYTKWGVHEFKARRDVLPRDLFDHGYDLDALVRVVEYAELKKIYLGVEEEPVGDRASATVPGGPATPAQPRFRTTPKEPEQNGTHPAPQQAAPPAQQPRRAAGPAPRPPARTEPEPPPPADDQQGQDDGNGEWTPTSGDTVSFMYRGEQVEGVIKSSSPEKQVAKVQVTGWNDLAILGWDELRLLEVDTTFDAPPEPPPPPPPPAPAQRQRPTAPAQSRQAPQPRQAAPAPAAAPADPWDDNDGQSFERKPAPAQQQPARRQAPPPPADDEPPPATGPRGRGKR